MAGFIESVDLGVNIEDVSYYYLPGDGSVICRLKQQHEVERMTRETIKETIRERIGNGAPTTRTIERTIERTGKGLVPAEVAYPPGERADYVLAVLRQHLIPLAPPPLDE